MKWTNPFKVNHNYREKDKILRALYEHWEEGERNSSYSHQIQPLGKALSVLDLQDKTNLHRRVIERLLTSLSTSGKLTCSKKIKT